jgi:cell wall-associated NlpC family hydrolase
MIPADRVVEESRKWVGTPFLHQGRKRGIGVDCAGVVVGVAAALGLPHEDRLAYSRTPDGATLEAILDRHLVRCGRRLGEGHIALFRFSKHPQHVGIVTRHPSGGWGLVHGYARMGCCEETRLDERWLRRLVRVYRWEAVA